MCSICILFHECGEGRIACYLLSKGTVLKLLDRFGFMKVEFSILWYLVRNKISCKVLPKDERWNFQ